MKQSLLLLLGLTALVGCTVSDAPVVNPVQPQKSIVILYENDVHGGIDGYTKIAGFRDAIQQSDTAWAGVVSCGDFLQGGVSAAITKGQGVVDIMKSVRYDAITIGNHEFDYLAPRMIELMPQLGAPIVCANFFEYGATTPVYAPYTIKTYGDKRVAFVGVCTPETMDAERYAFYDKDGKQLYDLKPEETYALVQQATDNALQEGADYVVVLAHLGESNKSSGVYSHGLVEATKGIDVVLDGHSHSAIEHTYVKNLEGKEIPVTQTGSEFVNLGKLLISKDGKISTTLIPVKDINYESAEVTAATNKVKADMESVTLRKLATSTFEFECKDDNGGWKIRSSETNLGDLVTDAFRIRMKAGIGLMNAGGIRNGIKAGDITYGDVFNVLPNDDHLVVIEATGEQIIVMLEKSTAKCPDNDGNFPQVSYLRYTVHTGSHTVSDIEVYDATAGKYLPIDKVKTYTIVTTDYYANGAYYNTLKSCKLLESGSLVARDCLSDYIESLGKENGLSAYATSQGRVTIKND